MMITWEGDECLTPKKTDTKMVLVTITWEEKECWTPRKSKY